MRGDYCNITAVTVIRSLCSDHRVIVRPENNPHPPKKKLLHGERNSQFPDCSLWLKENLALHLSIRMRDIRLQSMPMLYADVFMGRSSAEMQNRTPIPSFYRVNDELG